jgi:hypothetical protein
MINVKFFIGWLTVDIFEHMDSRAMWIDRIKKEDSEDNIFIVFKIPKKTKGMISRIEKILQEIE